MEGSASSPATSGGGPVGAANTGKPGATGEEVLDKKRLQVCLLKSRLLHSHWVIQADRKSGNQGRPNGPFNFFGKNTTSAFSTDEQSRFASVVLDGVLGPPRQAFHT